MNLQILFKSYSCNMPWKNKLKVDHIEFQEQI